MRSNVSRPARRLGAVALVAVIAAGCFGQAEPSELTVFGPYHVVAALSDDPAATEFLRFLLSDDAADPWRDGTGTIVPRASVDRESDAPLDRLVNELIDEAPEIVFDASDIMPGAIGNGSFWAGMVDLVSGRSVDDVAAGIQASVDSLSDD
jgi:alpha-glucoside transport system substrate-binding protein